MTKKIREKSFHACINSSLRLLTLLPFIFLASNPAGAEIVIDGELNETEWQQAETFEDFVVTRPFSLEAPTYKTKVMIYSDLKGVYVGFVNQQPVETRDRRKHKRDRLRQDYDRNVVVIDFDNKGNSAYMLGVSLSESLLDFTITNESDIDGDWDGEWYAKTSESEENWYSEFFIPWTMVSMNQQEGPNRKIGIATSRLIQHEAKYVAFPKASPLRKKFLSLLHTIEVVQSNPTRLDFYPYFVAKDDFEDDDVSYQAGSEIFFANGKGGELSVTLNPDFGQVESDNIVINYSARETFYSDKRPFFTQSQSLFDISNDWYPGFELYSIIHTRRIGARPDYDCSKYGTELGGSNEEELACQMNQKSNNDIDAAVKYTQMGEKTDFGFFSAFEHDEDFSKGKDFFAFRTSHRAGVHKIGHMFTQVKRNAIDRDATVNAIDYQFAPNEIIKFDSLLIYSDSNEEQSGFGTRNAVIFEHNKTWRSGAEFYYYDDKLNINDMGYLYRNNAFSGGANVNYTKTDFDEDSPVLSRNINIDYWDENNADNVNLDESLSIFFMQRFKDTSSIHLNIFAHGNGKEDDVTRGNLSAPFIKKSNGVTADFSYNSRIFGKWQADLGTHVENKDYFAFTERTTNVSTGIRYFPIDNLRFYLKLSHKKTNDWFIWRSDNHYATYQSKNTTIKLNMRWYPDDRQELQVKLEAVAFRNQDGKGWTADSAGNLSSLGTAETSINTGRLSFQIRYKYEIAPLSNIYLVYTRGGNNFFEDEAGTSKIYRETWENPESNRLVLKARIKF